MSNLRAELRRQAKEEKKQAVVYHFTAEQLEERDRAIIDEYLERVKARAMIDLEQRHREWEKKIDAQIQDEWDERARQFDTPDHAENFMNLLQYLLCVSSRVLIEKFGWAPIPKEGERYRKTKTERFAMELIEEIDRITGDDMLDVRKYAEETYSLYGVKYTRSPVAREGATRKGEKTGIA